MGTLFICPAGTSIGALPPGVEAPKPIEARIAAKIAWAEQQAGDDIEKFLNAVSAETNGLVRADCGPHDEVLILASDTSDGRAAAEAVRRLVEDKLGAKARVQVVEGLQVLSEHEFRQKGIRTLIQIAKREADAARAKGKHVVFNVTGGFKSVVPYLTLLGMFEGIDVVCVYEQSDALIRLPPLPVRFDQDRIAFALPALQALNKRGVMTESDFEAELPGHGWRDDPIFEQLIERSDGMVAPSGAGELALAGFQPAESKGKVFLHRRAQQSGQFATHQVRAHLPRMNDAAWRSIPEHCASHPNTDMNYCKCRGGAAPRIFYWLEGNDVYVADILLHAPDYQPRFLNGEITVLKRDYGPDQFELFEGAPLDSPADAYGEALTEFLEHNDKERVRLAALTENLTAQNETLRRKQDEASRRIKHLEQDLATERSAASRRPEG